MLRILTVFSIVVLSSFARAANLNCEMKRNGEPLLQAHVETNLQNKTLIANQDPIIAYVSEKPGHVFVVESFLADYEARIYAEGILKQSTDHLQASLWGRNLSIDIQCQLDGSN